MNSAVSPPLESALPSAERRRWFLAGLMMTMMLAAIGTTIVIAHIASFSKNEMTELKIEKSRGSALLTTGAVPLGERWMARHRAKHLQG